MSKPRVLIIGAGAAGLMAGITAARNGANVTILEHMDRPGRKILATGNGRCNLTNLDQNRHNYHGSDESFPIKILGQFNVTDTIRFFSQLGIYTKNRGGYIYPNSAQASSVLEVLLLEASHLNIKIKCSEHVEHIEKQDDRFQVRTKTWKYESETLILAAGSKAAPVFGSDGSGYQLAAGLGHSIVEPLQALVQLRAKGNYFNHIAGVKADARIRLLIDDEPIHNEDDGFSSTEDGELLFTNYGISGIPVLQISGRAVRAIHYNKRAAVVIDYFPDFTDDQLQRYIRSRIQNTPYKSSRHLLLGMINKKLSDVFLKQVSISPAKSCSTLTDKELAALVKLLKNHQLSIIGGNAFDQAQVCSGGIHTSEINPLTLESAKVKSLYFAGEIIDIDGACGGYNLQWAWSSGYVAGINAQKGIQ